MGGATVHRTNTIDKLPHEQGSETVAMEKKFLDAITDAVSSGLDTVKDTVSSGWNEVKSWFGSDGSEDEKPDVSQDVNHDAEPKPVNEPKSEPWKIEPCFDMMEIDKLWCQY